MAEVDLSSQARKATVLGKMNVTNYISFHQGPYLIGIYRWHYRIHWSRALDAIKSYTRLPGGVNKVG